MLKQLINENLIEARGIIGFYPCNSNDKDDIEIYDPETSSNHIATLHTLRQQLEKDADNFLAMSDFIAPKTSEKTDYIGMFAVSAGFNQEVICKKYEADHDDYNIMLVKTLTDRLAEAFAE
jgi:5-methyltetrahydrofolate--homocysteine methyltransferase